MCHVPQGARPQGQPPLAQLLTRTSDRDGGSPRAAQGPAGAPQGAGRGQGALRKADWGPAGQRRRARSGIPNVPIDEC